MSTATRLLREDLRDFAGYASARRTGLAGEVWLNANEAATPSIADPQGLCRRYPQPQPAELVAALARLYGVQPRQLLATRGSDEGIDLLLRAFCPPGGGAIVIAPPVFGMYAVCARLNGTKVVEVAAREEAGGWHSDLEAMGDAAIASGATLVMLCTPGNPTGEAIAQAGIAALATRLQGKALVVVDAAYAEFCDAPPDVPALLARHDNIVVLRTLSKAHALAGARIGAVLGEPALVAILQRCQAPYPLAEPAVRTALAALQPSALAASQARSTACRAERTRMLAALAALPGVRRAWPSQGNFLLVAFHDAQAALDALLATGVVVRDMRASPQLPDALRISVGTAAENARVLAALAGAKDRAA